VPELVGNSLNPRRLADTALGLLRDDAQRGAMCRGLLEFRELLGPPGAVQRAADLAEEFLDQPAARPAPQPQRSKAVAVCE
jgi:hypothetical protein